MDYRRIRRLTGWNVCPSPKVYYFIEEKDGKDVGAIMAHELHGLYRVHVHMTKDCRGKDAAEVYRDVFQWIFDNTDAEKIVGEVPIDLKGACYMAKHVGATFDGIDADVLRCYSLTRDTFMKEAA